MKFFAGIVLAILLPFLSNGQCPVINTAMINACAQAPSTAEGINEFVYFSTTSSAAAGNYTLSYGTGNPPLGGGSTNTLAGTNATAQNGTGSIVTSNGCTITYITSPATVIPANSGVILIPSNFDNIYDLSGICTGTNLYVVLVDITAAPSSTWNAGGTFANASGASPRYLQVSNAGNNCSSNIVTYSGNGWPGNVDGNSVWWGGSGNSYQNNGCNIIKPPKPTVTPSAIAAVCEKSTSASMAYITTGNPNQYSIDWDNTANAAGFADINAAVLMASPLSVTLPSNAPAATYTGSLTVINSLTPDTSIAQNISITINAAPVITVQPSTAVQNVCQNGAVATLGVTVTAGSGSITGYQWYINTTNSNTAGFPIPFATLSSYLPSSSNLGTLYFYCKVTNSNGCSTTSDVSGALIVSPNIVTPTASVTQQPTCAMPTATIVVTAPTGVNIQYSNGSAYQVSGTFTNLAPGTSYNITAKNVVTGCTSPVKAVPINAVPPAPTVTATVTTQPTCTMPTGTITISAPLGLDFEYSIGGAYQGGTLFAPLINSTTYNVTVRQISTGCISAILPLTITPIAGAPARPDIIVTHPDCNIPSGSITVTAPLNANYQYSIGGAYQNGLSFASLTPGTNYSVTVKDILTGCISAPHDTAMKLIPVLAPPGISTPIISYCQNEPASILTATGTNLQWYNNLTGSVASTTAPTPVTTTPGVFKFYVSQKSGTCESTRDSITVTVNSKPGLPGTAGNTTTYCQSNTATVLTATGTNLQWYDVVTGGTPLAGAPTAPTSSPGPVTYYVSQKINGCESDRASITITVNPIPNTPGIINSTIQYCHNKPAIPLTATGTNLLWYTTASAVTGSATAPTPLTNVTGSAFYYVSQTVNGCESGRNLITVTVVAVPTPPVTAPIDYCQNQISAPLNANGAGLQWYATLTSTTILPTPIPVTTIVGSTKYYVSQFVNGCESKRDSITVTIKPASLPPQVVSPLEYCQGFIAPALAATGTNLQWYPAFTGGAGSSTAPTPVTTTPATTFFYVTQNTNGCESTPRTAITVSVKLTSTAVSGFRFTRDTVCLNGLNPSPSFDPGFTTGGIFISSPPGLSMNAATGDINLTASSQGTYNITYTYNTTGCVIGSASSSGITLNPAIPIELRFSYNSPVCKDAVPVLPQTFANFTTSGTFTSIPGGLSINATTGVIDVSNSSPDNYSVFYNMTEQGCRQAGSSSAGINIVDTTSPVTKFNYSATDICLVGSAVNPTIIKAAGFTTGGTFSVTPAGLRVNSTSGDVNIGLSVAGTYVIKYSVPSLLCRHAGSDSIVFKLKNYGTPVVGFSYVGPVCKGDTNAVPVPGVNFTEGGAYSAITTGLVVDATSGIIDLIQSTAGTHTIKYEVAQDVCNPAGSGQQSIVVLAQPQAPTVSSASVCGEGNIILNAAALGIISWYTEPALINQVNIGSSFSTFINRTTFYYATNKVGTCESEPAVASGVVYPIPAKPYLGRDTSICPNEKLILNAGAYNSYLWQDGSIAKTYSVSNSGIYKVIVSTGIGCSDSTSINITILDDCNDIVFPNTFAPNGVNRTFKALGSLLPVSKYVLRIYNRYGQEIFVTADPAKAWDGTYLGKPVIVGTYVYVATYIYKNKTDRVKKGTITVIR